MKFTSKDAQDIIRTGKGTFLSLFFFEKIADMERFSRRQSLHIFSKSSICPSLLLMFHNYYKLINK